MSNINNKEKCICKKCGAKFYIIKNPLKKCPTCKSTSIDKLEVIKLPLQVIYYDKDLKKVEVFASNFNLQSIKVSKTGWYILSAESETLINKKFIRLDSFPKKGLAIYLSSFFFPSIGEETAKKIAESSLAKALIENKKINIDYSNDSFFLSAKNINIINSVWKKKVIDNLLHVLLRELGLGHAASNDIVSNRFSSAIDLLNNPYSLLGLIPYVDIKNVENIIDKLALKISENQKISGILEYSIKEIEKRYGHTSFYKKLVFKKFIKFYSLEESEFDSFTKRSKNFVISNLENNEIITSKYSYDRDKDIAIQLKMLNEKKKKKIKVKNISSLGKGSSATKEQIAAVNMALNNNISVITGGPGTGKTTVLSLIANQLKNNKIKFALTALTGKASRRISEIKGLEKTDISTIHLLLVKAEANIKPSPIDQTLIIDEASMLDITLMQKLVRSLDKNSKLIFVGDVDQLPPISPGQVFKDLIESKKIPSTKLTNNFRQKNGKQIVINANKIIKGEVPIFEGDTTQFEFIEQDNEKIALDIILQKYLHYCKKPEDMCVNTQILIPMKKGILGSYNINKSIQKEVGRNKELLKKNDDIIIYENDIVIQTKNNYKLGVINGDIGKIIGMEVEGKKKSIIVNINGQDFSYEGKDIFDFDPAYAFTIHRSQGSEYDNVIMPISQFHEFMLDPKLLYTAVTRAKKKVLLIGNKKSFIKGLKSNWKYNRLTFLKNRIQDFM